MLEIRHVALAVLVIVTANPPAAKLMVVTSLPCPLTVIFLFDQEIFPDEQLPGPMLTVSPSIDLLTAFCRAIVIAPEQATSLIVCARHGPALRTEAAETAARMILFIIDLSKPMLTETLTLIIRALRLRPAVLCQAGVADVEASRRAAPGLKMRPTILPLSSTTPRSSALLG